MKSALARPGMPSRPRSKPSVSGALAPRVRCESRSDSATITGRVQSAPRGYMDEQGFTENLVRRAQAGDGQAFEDIVRRLEWPLRTWLVARCPPGADADDIAQSTFLEAFTRLGTFTPGTDF